MTVYALVTGTKNFDQDIDQVCTDYQDAKREAKDLREMGCKVKIEKFKCWKAFDKFEEQVRGW